MTSSDFGIVNVDLVRLDRLLNLVGELVITRTTFIEQSRQARAKYGFKEQVLNLLQNTERLGRIGEEIQSRIIKARLIPVGVVFNRFESFVRELSKRSEKEIELHVIGESTEVDKRTIDELVEPLVHLVRNSLDHGIETVQEREQVKKRKSGTITLEAFHEGSRLVVEVRDDGAGIDVEKVREKAISNGLVTTETLLQMNEQEIVDMIFYPGFSTKGQVTGMSGRGVGLDAARRRIHLMGGRLQVYSKKGQGTRTRIELPLTTAIVEALMVGIEQETYALPLEHVEEIIRVPRDQISTVDGRQVIDIRGKALSLIYLSDVTELERKSAYASVLQVVIVRFGKHEVGIAVDRIMQRNEIVIKGMGQRLAGIRGIAGASIGGDGNVIMVLDVPSLCKATIENSSIEGTEQ